MDAFEKCFGVCAGDGLSLSVFLHSLPVQVAVGVCERVMAILPPRLGAAQHRGLEVRLPAPSLPHLPFHPCWKAERKVCQVFFLPIAKETRDFSP